MTCLAVIKFIALLSGVISMLMVYSILFLTKKEIEQEIRRSVEIMDSESPGMYSRVNRRLNRCFVLYMGKQKLFAIISVAVFGVSMMALRVMTG